MGKPTSWTPEVQAVIVEAIRRGNYKVTACALAGIHRDTLNDWEHRGARGDEPYASFLAELQRAEADAETGLLEEIRTAEGGKDATPWQSRAWVMERRWPKRWAQRIRSAVSEELTALLKRIEAKLDPETYAKVVDAAREDDADAQTDARH